MLAATLYRPYHFGSVQFCLCESSLPSLDSEGADPNPCLLKLGSTILAVNGLKRIVSHASPTLIWMGCRSGNGERPIRSGVEVEFVTA